VIQERNVVWFITVLRRMTCRREYDTLLTKLRLKPPSDRPADGRRIFVTRRPRSGRTLRQLLKPNTCLDCTDIGFRRCLSPGRKDAHETPVFSLDAPPLHAVRTPTSLRAFRAGRVVVRGMWRPDGRTASSGKANWRRTPPAARAQPGGTAIGPGSPPRPRSAIAPARIMNA
jgi:hypothetical protein